MPNLSADLDSAISTLQQDLSTIAPEDVFAVLENWQQQLQGLAIADDLGKLKDALRKQKSADAIANLLIDLGEDTASELTIETSDETAAKLRQLSSLLTEAGKALRG